MKAVRALSIVAAILIAIALLSPLNLRAQQEVATPTSTAITLSVANPNVVITSPRLVSELHGTVQVIGTATLAGMRNYFLETRSLNPDASEPPANTPWLPTTLPASIKVENGVLGSWDTTQIPDGLYELRLNVISDNAPSTYFVVTPLRITNAGSVPATAVATSAVSGAPVVTAQLSANVRLGDSIYSRVLGNLPRDSSASVLGISSTGSGWYYIQLSDGTKGWIAPSAVIKSGDFSNVPVVNPPALLTFTPTPNPSGLVLNGIALNPAVPVCGVTFTVAVNVNNAGKFISSADSVYIRDIDQKSGAITATAVEAVPALNPNANFVVTAPLTVTTYYNEVHQIQATIDGHQITTAYTLAQGGCNR